MIKNPSNPQLPAPWVRGHPSSLFHFIKAHEPILKLTGLDAAAPRSELGASRCREPLQG